MSPYVNLDQTSAFQPLTNAAASLPPLNTLISPDRIKEYQVSNDDLSFFYGCSQVNDHVLDLFDSLAKEQGIMERYAAVLNGEKVNVGEDRPVSHHHTRMVEQENTYLKEHNRISAYVHKIHHGLIKSVTNKPFTDVVQIGIGGSDLGPRAIYNALRRYVEFNYGELPLRAHFISNVDPDDAVNELAHLDLDTTLFVVVSKSGSTLETLANVALVKDKLQSSGARVEDYTSHFVAVTTKGSVLDSDDLFSDVFYIDDAIGGRFSVTSAVGALLLSLVLGNHVFTQVLEGARAMDRDALNPDLRSNMSALSAMISVWESSFLGYCSKAIIPYSTALSQFPKHLQQLICESNGKRVSLNGDVLDYGTSPVIFGEPGTNGQHSFFQMLHQGTGIVPVQFIGFSRPQMEQRSDSQAAMNHDKLIANLIAQMVALAAGQDNDDPAKRFPGNRPSSLIYGEQLTPRVMGALLSFYENQTMFQGFLWNINSFDQEGVQLGKQLAKDVLSPSGASNDHLTAWKEALRTV